MMCARADQAGSLYVPESHTHYLSPVNPSQQQASRVSHVTEGMSMKHMPAALVLFPLFRACARVLPTTRAPTRAQLA